MTAEAGAPARYFDGSTATPHPAAVRLQGEMVAICLAGGAVVAWPRRRVAGADLVAPDGTATLRCAGEPGRLQLADPLLLRSLRSAARVSYRLLLAAALGVGAILALLAGAPLLSTAARLVPDRWQDRLGEAAIRDSFGALPRCRGAAGQAALDRLAGRLAAAGGIAGPVVVEVLPVAQVNAFALPARRVVVLRGLLDRMQDGDELAGVLGHELGHVLARDPLVGFLRANLLLAASSLGGWGHAGLGTALLTLSYSRGVEARADAASLRLLQAAGMRSTGLARALRRMDGDGRGGSVWLSDHPMTPDRIAANPGTATGAPPLSDAEWAAIRGMCARPLTGRP